MKAHFIASGTNLESDIKTYRQIVKILYKCNVPLTHEWVEQAYSRIKSEKRTEENISWKNEYRTNIEAISKADIVIAEISRKSFLVGFQVASALQLKKPILLLSSHDEVETAIGASLNEDIIKFVKYTRNNLEDKIVEFINENSVRAKNLRFNFFIDRKILNYLNWASLRTGDTKSEVIRKLLIKEISNSEYDK
jgi:hypothetical protein